MNFTDAEVGLYIRLLCIQWSAGSLPDDDGELSDYGRGKTPLARIKAKFVKGEDGRLRNARLEAERQKQNEFRLKQAENGKLGGRPRNPSLTQAFSNGNPNESQKKLSVSNLLSPIKGEGNPPSDSNLTASERISLERSLERLNKRLVEIKEADLGDFPEERRTLKIEKKRILKTLGLKA